MFLLHYNTTPPAGHVFDHDGATGILQRPDGSIESADLIVPELKGDAPFCEFEGLLVTVIDGTPNFCPN